MMAERRGASRRRVRLGCKLAPLDGDYLLDCQMKDFSASGARIDLQVQAIPDTVYLMDMQSRLAYHASVVWRRPPECGLRFLRIYRFDEIPVGDIRRLIENELA